MRRTLVIAAVAIFVGIAVGEFLTNNISFRRWIGHVVRRGELQLLVGRGGIYDSDIARAWEAELFARGAEPQDVETTAAEKERRVLLARLIEREKLNVAAAGQPIPPAAVERAMNLLRSQFGDEKTWTRVLRTAATMPGALRRNAAANLRDRAWIEEQIAAQIQPNEQECRRYFATHRETFQEPLRLRTSHLFLAAPEGYPPAVIEAKRALINLLDRRIRNGESFPGLVAEFSEDEATKRRAGDLGFFSTHRMLPEIFAAAQQLRLGETSAPVRSRLGFHLLHLAAILPPRQKSFEQALPGIVTRLENEKRAAAVRALIKALPGKIKFAGPRNQSQFERAAVLTSNGTF